MKIVAITAGAAGMYCGSCLHDNRLAAALLELGEDVVLVPTYTPIRTDEPDVSVRRVFLGGINVFLQQRSSLFGRLPRPMRGWLDRPWLLERLAGRAGATAPAELGEVTVSMLDGVQGRQGREFHRLVEWVARDVRPDVVHLSNTLLSGLAGPLREALDVPLVCTLSGEDSFVEKLPAPYRQAARQRLSHHCGQFDALIAMNGYYADFMSGYLGVARARIHVIRHGLRLDGYGDRSRAAPADAGPTIGYLARICPDKGLDQLAEACLRLRDAPALREMQLRVAGYVGSSDRRYLDEQLRKLADAGVRCQYVGEVDRDGKLEFLESIDCFCLPTVYRESKGISAIEALASGVPIVVPRHGCFPELIDATGGGVLFEPFDIAGLADQLERLLRDPALARQLGQQGRRVVHAEYHDRRMAEQTRALYRERIAARRAGGGPAAAPGEMRE